jgi:hypothetical protein
MPLFGLSASGHHYRWASSRIGAVWRDINRRAAGLIQRTEVMPSAPVFPTLSLERKRYRQLGADRTFSNFLYPIVTESAAGWLERRHDEETSFLFSL